MKDTIQHDNTVIIVKNENYQDYTIIKNVDQWYDNFTIIASLKYKYWLTIDYSDVYHSFTIFCVMYILFHYNYIHEYNMFYNIYK